MLTNSIGEQDRLIQQANDDIARKNDIIKDL